MIATLSPRGVRRSLRLMAAWMLTAALLFSLALPVQGGPASAIQAPATGSAKVWAQHYAEFEDYIRGAAIDHFEDVPLGVTKPKRAWFKPGGLTGWSATR